MKKLLVLAAFLGLGYVSVNAQTVAPSTPAKQAPKAAVTNDKAEITEVNTSNSGEAKTTATKKECSTSEKKSCSSASGKKSCCASKGHGTTAAPAAPAEPAKPATPAQ